MLIRTVTLMAEETLLNTLQDKRAVAKSFLLCGFSGTDSARSHVDDLLVLLKDILKDHSGVLYFCVDGDVVIEWAGASKEVKTAIENEIEKYCLRKQPDWKKEGFFRYYDINAHGEELRIMCRQKIIKPNHDKSLLNHELKVEVNKEIKFTAEQSAAFNNAIKKRESRQVAEVLIVEDQAFSRTLLVNILARNYKHHVAKNAAEALALYSGLAPDIILLDVELPDINGHNIAKLIRSVDPKAWIIMVTANNYQSDVIMAKENKVQGFIVKPYNKGKILEIIGRFRKN